MRKENTGTIVCRAVALDDIDSYAVGYVFLSTGYVEDAVHEVGASSIVGATIYGIHDCLSIALANGALDGLESITVTHPDPEVCLALAAHPYHDTVDYEERQTALMVRDICRDNNIRFRIVPCRGDNASGLKLISRCEKFKLEFDKGN